jgi:hypothetical protein
MQTTHLNVLARNPRFNRPKIEKRAIDVKFAGATHPLVLKNLSGDPDDCTLRLCFPSGIQCPVIRIEKPKGTPTTWKASYQTCDTKLEFDTQSSTSLLTLKHTDITLTVATIPQYGDWEFLFTYKEGIIDVEDITRSTLNPLHRVPELTFDILARICSEFFRGRKNESYTKDDNGISILYLPQQMATCRLTSDATAVITHTDNSTETIPLKTSPEMEKFLEQWVGLPLYSPDE